MDFEEFHLVRPSVVPNWDSVNDRMVLGFVYHVFFPRDHAVVIVVRCSQHLIHGCFDFRQRQVVILGDGLLIICDFVQKCKTVIMNNDGMNLNGTRRNDGDT